MKTVKAPPMKASAAKFAAKPVSSLVDTGDSGRFICPLFYYHPRWCRALRGAAPPHR